LLLFYRVFSELCGRNLTDSTIFLGIEVGLKFSLFAHWRWWWGRFERTVLTHYSCCWGPLWQHSSLLAHCSCSLGPLWKHITCTLQFLVVAPLKAR